MSEIRKENLHETLVNEIEEKQNKTDETLFTESKDLVGAINELFQNVDSGKEIIADAIDDKNVTKNSTFAAMGEAIENIHADREEDRQKLIGILQENNMEITGTESMDTLLDLIDMSNIDLSRVKQIDCGDNFVFTLYDDGSLWSCGNNDYGQLGLDDTTTRTTFTQVTTNVNNDVKQVICGINHLFIIKDDGSVWSCGYNGNGNLGLGDDTNRNTFTQVTTNINNDVKQIACGYHHTLMIKNDGSLWACGRNNCGQLGLGDTTNRSTFTQVTSVNNDVKQIACGGYYYQGYTNGFSVLLKNDGSVWTCGINNRGQLGLGGSVPGTDRNVFTQVTTNVNNDVEYIACGYEHTFILKNDGSVWSCGFNEFGQLGFNDSTDRTTFTKVEVTNGTVVQIDGGASHTFILRTDGSVWACGRNDKGQLGLGTFDTTLKVNSLKQITTDVEQIACCGSFTFLLKNDGTLWACGANNSGQLGLGDTTNKNIFTAVDETEALRASIQILNAANTVNKGNLSNVLTDENVELTGEETINELIILTDEKFDYMKDILFNKLIEKGIQCNEGMTFEEMINTLDGISNQSLYIYDNGVEHYPIEKGYVSTSNVATKYGTYLYCKTPFSYTGMGLQAEFTTSSKINVNNYSRLCAEAELVSGHVLQISLRNNKGSAFRKTDGTIVDRVAQTQILCHTDGYVRKNVSVDISNITGNYYISFLTFHTGGAHTTADSVAKCYRIWLEA